MSKFSGYAKEQFIYFLRSVYTPWPLSQEEDRQNERGYTSPARDVLCLGSFNDLEKLQEGKKKMKNKVLSVSIAAYNVAGTLREALDPFLESGVLDALDIMIVNDGSKDNTVEIATEYVAKYPGTFRLIDKENGGWGSTVNIGIEHACGTFFRQLDGDDYYNPENMAAYLEFLKNTTADLVVAPYVEYNDMTKEVISEPNCNPGCEIGKVYALEDIPSFAPFMHSMAVRTSLLQSKGLKITEHCFYTDTEFVLKSCNLVETVAFFDKPIYYYRRATSGQSMSLSGLEKHYKDNTKVIEVLLDYMNEQVTRDSVRKIYDNLLFGTCYWQYMVMLYIKPNAAHKKDLIAYDKMLKRKNPDYYNRIDLSKICKLRKTFFFGYRVAAKRQMEQDKRFDKDGRMLY